VRELQIESTAYFVPSYLRVDGPFSSDYSLHYGNTAEDLIDLDVVIDTSKEMIGKIEKIINNLIGKEDSESKE
jgi:hypothetical protein